MSVIRNVGPHIAVAVWSAASLVRVGGGLSELSKTASTAIGLTRSARVLNLLFHTLDLADTCAYTYRKGKEFGLNALKITALSGSIVEDTAIIVIGFTPMIASKVAIIATHCLYVGAALQLASIAHESYRVGQTAKELIGIKKHAVMDKAQGKANYTGLSHKQIYGLKLSQIASKEDSADLASHLKSRLQWRMALRIATVVGADMTSLAALGIFIFAPGVSQAAWGLVGAAAVIGLTCLILKEVTKHRHNKQFEALPYVSEELKNGFATERLKKKGFKNLRSCPA